ncbi:MAG: zinc-dependent alcohol dehydrogenase family protein [Streptococcaceae bacterium]|jgi:alcohol dehydrogenase|nr:zinc-dependent alcohol dehydrogenase family protein [Streptococcaceae bacterium]MCH4178199.1 zinc-dependent alcohol dehydrogenase family protein [Streptococcaceae bacterium]
MKAAIFIEPKLIEVKQVAKPEIERSTDALIHIIRASVCGSDLWWYRGISKKSSGPVGHEAIGVIESVGSAVKNFKKGDFVIIPFTHGCGQCRICLAGFEANCPNVESDYHVGYQAEYLRAINADGALVKIPGKPSDYSEAQLASLTTLADVMPTGYHAAVSAEVKSGDTVVVFGDGAVGLCGVISAKLLGAKRIIAMSRHEDRAKLAREFGATEIIAERGDEAVEKVLAMTDGLGADAVLECVGTALSTETAFKVARAGAVIGRVGVPHDVDYQAIDRLFWRNIGLKGGIASVAKYDKAILLDKVLDGSIQPGRVFTATFELDQIQSAYQAMDERQAIKSLIKIENEL